jgi:uncharacterized protein (DUF779 family)
MAHDGETAAVSATPAALEAIQDLSAAQGPLVFFQSGGCCDGSSPLCLKDGELPLSPYDVCLGKIAGAPFYIVPAAVRARIPGPDSVISPGRVGVNSRRQVS